MLVILIGLSVAVGLNWNQDSQSNGSKDSTNPKKEFLRFALVTDSENENELLAKALNQAKGAGVNFVIGLGDWSSVGTLEELTATKKVFDESGVDYLVTAGDRDLWDSRNQGLEAEANFNKVFGKPSQVFNKEGIQFVILDNSDIYKGIDAGQLSIVNGQLSKAAELRFVFAHKTPFHPQSSHVMGENSPEVAKQAKELLSVLENNIVDGFFSGDLHFFARFNSPNDTVKMTTVGAVNAARNFQGPRFAIVTVYDDYSWEVGDIEIR